LAVMLSLAPLFWRVMRPATSKDLPEFAMNFAGRGFIGLQEKNTDVEKLKAWLATRNAPLPWCPRVARHVDTRCARL